MQKKYKNFVKKINMERNITITLEKAREWYNSDNESLKEVALQAFSEEELEWPFSFIKTLKDACDVLNINYVTVSICANAIANYSKASAAMFKLNIIRKALNLGQDLHLTKDPEDSCIYFPYNPFITKSSTCCNSEINSGKMEVIGKIKSEGEEYYVLSGYHTNNDGSNTGLGYFYPNYGVGNAYASVGFLGCANKEIAIHFGKYFGMLITEAKFGDMVDFEIIENKYQ